MQFRSDLQTKIFRLLTNICWDLHSFGFIVLSSSHVHCLWVCAGSAEPETSWSGRRVGFVSFRWRREERIFVEEWWTRHIFLFWCHKTIRFYFPTSPSVILPGPSSPGMNFCCEKHLEWLSQDDYLSDKLCYVRDFKSGRTSHFQHKHLILSPVTINWQRHKVEKPCEL